MPTDLRPGKRQYNSHPDVRADRARLSNALRYLDEESAATWARALVRSKRRAAELERARRELAEAGVRVGA